MGGGEGQNYLSKTTQGSIDNLFVSSPFAVRLIFVLPHVRCDLSISAGSRQSASGDSILSLEGLADKILVNQTEAAWLALHQAAGGQGRHHLGHRDLPLRDGDAGPRGHHLDDGAPRDPRQDDAAGQRRGDQLEAAGLCPQEGEEVHGAHLCDLVVLAVEPEALVAALALRNLQASIKYGRMGQSKKLLCKFLYRIVLIIFVLYTGTVYHDWLV